MTPETTPESQQMDLQKRLTAFNQVIVQLMKVTSIDQLCREAISLGIKTLGFDRLSLYFTHPSVPHTITGTYGTDPTGQLCVEYGITLQLSENDWLINPAFLKETHSGLATNKILFQPEKDNQVRAVGTGWNAAAGLWDGEQLIGYLFTDNLLHQHPYTATEGELLAAYGLALGHLCTRLRTEAALHQRQLDYRALLEAIPDLLFSFDREGTLLGYHRPTGAQLYTETVQIIGKNLRDLVPAALTAQTMTAIATTCATGECVTFEYSLPIATETHYYEARVIEAGDGIIIALVRDMTDRKFLEEKLIAAHKMESLGRMAGGIAHDFNNLLTVIQGFTGLAERQVEPHQPQLSKALTQIAIASEKGARLTSQLLSFARKQMVAPQILDLNYSLPEMQLVLRQLLKSTIELQIVPALEPMRVRIARSQLEQLLINLATNADDAIADRGTLQIRTTRITLSESAAQRYLDARAGEYVLMEVTDNGAGIAPAIMPKIFDPFFTTKQVAKHSGLGLAICHGIVQQSGGHIAVRSTLQVATTFQIFLPYIQGQSSSLPPAHPKPEGQGQETILLVEDDTDVRTITTDLLLAFGYTVLPFAKGTEAVAFAQQQPTAFDLLVTDMLMPRMNGQEVASALLAIRPQLPVLLVSGYVEALPDDLVNLTTVDFLAKPYATQSLARRVRALLDQH